MSKIKVIRGEHLWVLGFLLLVVCFLNVGWKWPFSKLKDVDQGTQAAQDDQNLPAVTSGEKENPEEIQTTSGKGYRTSIPKKASADLGKSYDIYGSTARIPSFKTPLSELPCNISYKSKQDLALVHPHTFQESVQDEEGVILYDDVGNGLDTIFSLRGFTRSSSTVVLVDGVRFNEILDEVVYYPLLNVQDVDSIQIERGSASSIYGPNAFAGVVSITTGQPSSKPVSIFGGFEVASHHGIDFFQGISGTIEDKWTPLGGKFKYYFKGGRDLGDGFRGNGAYRITNFDIKTSYELPDEGGRLFFNWKHTDDLVKNPGELTFQQYQDSPKITNKPVDRRSFKNTTLSFGGDKTFWDDRILASIMSSWRWNTIEFFSTSGTFMDFVTGSNPDTDRARQQFRATDLIWQVAYRDNWKWFGLESLIGMDMRSGAENSEELDAFGGALTPGAAIESNRSSRPRGTALFWRETFKFWEKIFAHIGMRHDFFGLRTDDNLTPANSISRRWHHSSVSTGITVKPIRWADIFANFSQGFRAPTISELAGFGTINPDLQPETSDSYEVGTRLHYRDKAALKCSYFLIDMKDEIVFDSTSITLANPWGQNINIGKSRRTGIELGIEATPVPELKMYGTYTWTKAYVRETDGGGALIDGRAIGQVPENRLTWGIYCWPLKRFGEWFEGLRLSLNGIYTGRQHPTSYESTTQATLNATGGAGHWIKAYTVWNFMASYVWRGKEIYFKINNVFDAKYYSRAVCATSWGTAIYPAGTYTFVNPGAPREFVLGSRWEF